MKHLTAITALACCALPQMVTAQPSCHSKDEVLTQLTTLTDGARTELAWRAGHNLGWRFTGVGADSVLRLKGYSNRDILSEICGLPIDQLQDMNGGECCAPAGPDFRVVFLRKDGTPYEMRLPAWLGNPK